MNMRLASSLGAALLALQPTLGLAATTAVPTDGSVLPYPEPPFNGVINGTAADSKPDFPKAVTPPKGAPNILLILTDDVGFGATRPFGGPIATPTLQSVADDGLRFSKFHTTALCSPTRAALITGRNHHSCASGVITEMATGYPGYDSLVPKSCGSVGEVLRENGYSTSWFGKMHNVPDWMSSRVGPFDLWPSGQLGFDYFFGFIGGDTDQWHSAAFENTVPVELEEQSGTKLTHFDQILADRAIAHMRYEHALAPSQPWFMYYATGSAHAPHQAPKEWIAKYKGKFDMGWDKMREITLANQIKMGVLPPFTKLSKRPDGIPAWESLTPEQKHLYAHMMEVYAAALSYADYNIGRVVAELKAEGQYKNTVIMYIMGDNGASAEGTMSGTTNEVGTAANGVKETIPYLQSMYDQLGGPHSYGHYPVGWAHAMDSPMQYTKQVASHFGGTRNGLAISWPGHITDTGAIRSQFASVIDITPTIYEITGIKVPVEMDGVAQKPLDGVSMAYLFDKANANAPERHSTQYFELVGNRGIYKDGWMANTTPARLPWQTSGAAPSPNDFKWELYNINEDPSQSNDLAAKMPDKLKELQAAFLDEAKKYQVLPLDSSFAERADPSIRPSLTRGRTAFQFYDGMIRIPEGSAPDFKNTSFVVDAIVNVPKGGADGVLATIGGNFAGWSLFVMNGKPEFAYAYSNQPQHKYRVIGKDTLAPGNHAIRVDFKYDGGGLGKGATATLFVDAKQVAQGRVDHTVVSRFSLDETFDIGEDTGTPVVLDYESKMPFKFSGTLKSVNVLLKPEALTDAQRAELLSREAAAFNAAQ